MRTLVFAVEACCLFVMAAGLNADESSRYYRPLRPGEKPPSHTTIPDGIAVVIPPFMPDTLLVSQPGKYGVEPNSDVRVTLAVDPKRFPIVFLKSTNGEAGAVRPPRVTKTRSIEGSATSTAEIDFGIVDVDVTLEVRNAETSAVDRYEFKVRKPAETEKETHVEVEFLAEPGTYSVSVGTIVRVHFAAIEGHEYKAVAPPLLKQVGKRVIRRRDAGSLQFVTEFEFEALEAGSVLITVEDATTPAESKSMAYEVRIRP